MAEWIEIVLFACENVKEASPLAMAEWIEISGIPHIDAATIVSASDGGVD